MFRFFLGVIAGFSAKKYYDENKDQVDGKLKNIVEMVNTCFDKNCDNKCCKNSDNKEIQAVEYSTNYGL